MDILKLTKLLNSSFEIKQVDSYRIQIKTGAFFPNGKPIVLFLEKEENLWILTDKKQVLKFMNDLYELKARDIKNCITGVLKVYKFKIKSGEIFVELPNEDAITTKLFDYIMCIGQLVNMLVFFDAPV